LRRDGVQHREVDVLLGAGLGVQQHRPPSWSVDLDQFGVVADLDAVPGGDVLEHLTPLRLAEHRPGR